MNIRHIWSVLCKESIINQDDNVISLIGVLEEVNSVITPLKPLAKKIEKLSIPFNYELVSYWTKETEKEVEMDVKVEVIDPSSKKIAETINKSIFPENSKKLRTRFKIQGIPITVNGRYTFRVSIKKTDEKDYKNEAEIPLDVKFRIEDSQRSQAK